MFLKNKIKKWLSEGLITSEQGEAILNYEKTKKLDISWWRLYGFFVLAAFSVGLGVISLIAANWQIIPAYVKLGVYFLFLSCIGFLILKVKIKNNSALLFESFLIFFMILCLGGIGLISQIYNIKGETHSALFFWAFISSGLMMLSHKKPVMYIWLIGLYIAFMSWIHSLSDPLSFKLISLHFFPFLFLSLLLHNRKIEKAFPFLLFRRRVCEEWAVFTGFVSLVFLHSQEEAIKFSEIPVFGLLWLLLFLAIVFSQYKRFQKMLLNFILILFFLFFPLASPGEMDQLGSMILSVLIFVLSALFFVSLRKKKLFVLCIVATIIRLVFFFSGLFVNLTMTGLVLIALGLIVVLIIQLFRMNKEKLIHWMEKLE